MRRIFYLSFFLPLNVFCQLTTTFSCETGNNVVERAPFGGGFVGGSYKKNLYQFSGAASLIASSIKGNHFNGFYIEAGRNITLGKKSFCLMAKYLYHPATDIIREQNASLYATWSLPHFEFTVGNNFRIYHLSLNYTRKNGFEFGNASVKEPFSLIYNITYRVMKKENKWNLNASVTNFDYFIYHQETNPMLKLNATYDINDKFRIFADYYYIRAGFMNIQADYFGYLTRLGVIWKLR